MNRPAWSSRWRLPSFEGGFLASKRCSAEPVPARRPRPPDSGTGERRRPIQTPRHRPRATLHRPISLMCHSVLHWVEDGFLAGRGACKEGGHGETNEESARLAECPRPRDVGG